MDFLKRHDQNSAFMAHFPNWSEMTEDDREAARKAWIWKDARTLVQNFGFDDDGDNNSHSPTNGSEMQR